MPPELQAVVDVPIFGGTLAVNSTVENAFDDDDLQLLQRFAAVMSEASQRHRDLMARQQVEAALRHSEERFRRMFEGHHAIMLLVSPDDGRIVAANPAAAEFYGYEQQALEGLRVFDLNTETMAEVTAAMAAIKTQRRQVYSFGHRRANGDVRQVEVRSSPVEVAGEVLLFSIVNDVTERQRMERELEAQRLRVAEADRLQALGEMAAGVAHEINQPLNGIRTFAEAALIGLDRGWSLDRADVREALGDIVGQVDRISDIIDHMRSFARGHDDVGELPLAIDDIVGGALKLIGSSLRTQGIELGVEVDSGLTCRGWANRLEQVLLNLLANARDALATRLVLQRTGDPDTGPDWRPRLWVRGHRATADGPVRLSVTDNAGGIPLAVLPRIFEPFYTTKPVGKGTGIGLAVVQSIVQQHGGTIEVDNRPGEGVTFVVVLPAAARSGAAGAGDSPDRRA
jgi:PAS domain S-box-containing protein